MLRVGFVFVQLGLSGCGAWRGPEYRGLGPGRGFGPSGGGGGGMPLERGRGDHIRTDMGVLFVEGTLLKVSKENQWESHQ